ncbi:MAG: hypothetical protein MJ126_05760 [Lachnospiraceae bacterium]|nr:hypothetical protein [Lachnospiraceae bacterium]
MRKIKSFRKWGIYELTSKEVAEYDFKYAVIDPDTMECPHPYLSPSDTDWCCDSLEEAIEWIKNY